MTVPTRAQILRAAVLIECQLSMRFAQTEARELPRAAWARCERASQLASYCRRRDWTAAATRCEHQLQQALEELSRQLQLAPRCRLSTTLRATLRELYGDLAALTVEYAALRIDLAQSRVAVTTEPILLEGVDLGRFQIELDWRRLGRGSTAYAVVALDPRPAQVNSSVTHPHVSDERLCEGDAASSIRGALDAGRLLDFFTIVAQVLATYNPSSAYVNLDRWSGAACGDCGDLADEPFCCERCQCDLCGDCSNACEACGRVACADCSAPCSGCSENHCRTCLTSCRTCHQDSCERCLSDEQCPSCRDRAAKFNEAFPSEEVAAG